MSKIEVFYILNHSHTDIGFTDHQDLVFRQHAAFIDQALDLCEKTADYPEEAQYRWTCEVTGTTERYLESAASAQAGALHEVAPVRAARRRRHAVQLHASVGSGTDVPEPAAHSSSSGTVGPRSQHRDAVRRKRHCLALRRSVAGHGDRLPLHVDQPGARRGPQAVPDGVLVGGTESTTAARLERLPLSVWSQRPQTWRLALRRTRGRRLREKIGVDGELPVSTSCFSSRLTPCGWTMARPIS